MQLNIAYPQNGSNKSIKISQHAVQRLSGHKILDTFDGKIIDKDLEGCLFQINGGCDRQGYPMSENFLTDKRKRPILKAGDIGYHCKRDGQRKRKTVRGTIVSDEVTMLNVSLIESNEKGIEGLTDKIVPISHWPKRINKVKAKLNIPIEEEVTPEKLQEIAKAFVLENAEDKENTKYPRLKITRFNSKRKQERKAKRQTENKERREKSLKLKQEFIEKNPQFKNIRI